MTELQTGRRRRFVVIGVTWVVAATCTAGCRDGGTNGSTTTAPIPETKAASTSQAPASTVPASGGSATTVVPTTVDDVAPTQTAADPTPAATVVATTVGDLLTEAEVAEIEQVLDDLDVLLAEIDADLAGVEDP